MKRNIIKKILFTMIAFWSIFSFWYSQDSSYFNSTQYLDILSTKLLSNQLNSNKDILNQFCSAVLTNSGLMIDDMYFYKPSESVFLYLICTNINEKLKNKFNPDFLSWESSLLKIHSFENLWIIDYWPNWDYDYCDPSKDMDNCDIFVHLPRVFNMLMNDVISFQQSRLYWLKNPDFDEDKIEDQVDLYSQDKFNILFCDETNWFYPQLCKTMKSYLKLSAKLVKWLEIIDYKNLLSKEKDLKCPSISSSEYSFLECWLLWHGYDIDSSYINLIYNEIFYYRLLFKFYENQVLSNPKVIAPSSFNKNLTTAKDYFRDKIYQLNREINRMHGAISNTNKILNEIYSSFPLHVWLLMYQEDLLNLRDNYLYKIVTPFYTLYWKLRNVQEVE